MAWQRRWRVDSREKLRAVAASISGMLFDAREPIEVIVRTERVEKTHDQRKLFHAICAEAAPFLHMTPEEVKRRAKEHFFGGEMVIEPGRLDEDEIISLAELLRKAGRYELRVQSSEDADAEQYSMLIDATYRWLAEQHGVVIPDRRTR